MVLTKVKQNVHNRNRFRKARNAWTTASSVPWVQPPNRIQRSGGKMIKSMACNVCYPLLSLSTVLLICLPLPTGLSTPHISPPRPSEPEMEGPENQSDVANDQDWRSDGVSKIAVLPRSVDSTLSIGVEVIPSVRLNELFALSNRYGNKPQSKPK